MIEFSMSTMEQVHFPSYLVELSIVSCSLSILGALMIIWSYFCLPEIRNPVRKLFTWLTLADYLTASGYLASAIATYSDNFQTACKQQSYITTYSSLVSFNLTIAIAIQLFSTVVFNFDGATKSMFVFVANLVSWSIPAIIIGIAGGKYNVLGKDFNDGHQSNITAGTGPWCWIDESNHDYTMWMFVTGKGWEILCYLLTTSLYVLLKVHLYLHHRHRRFEDFHETIRDEDQNFLYVWFVFFVIRVWGTIRFFMKIFNCDQHEPCQGINDDVLLYMQAFGDPSQAFCNFILFVILDCTVRNNIFSMCCRTKSFPSAELVNSIEDERTVLIRSSSKRS